MIEVRGAWNGGNLWGDCPVVKIGDWIWPNAIEIHYPDVRDLESAAAIAKRISNNRGTLSVATIVGRLQVTEREIPSGTVVYGGPNSFRARLTSTAVKDISTEKVVAVNRGKPISICDALKNREKYDGKILEIRGRFYGNSVGDATCPKLRTEHFEWPSIIGLDIPPWAGESVVPPATWSVDLKWYDSILHESSRVGAGGKNLESKKVIDIEEPIYGPALAEYFGLEDLSPLATIVGRFDSREDLEFMNVRLGYGHLGQLPARLVIVDVRDLARYKNSKASR